MAATMKMRLLLSVTALALAGSGCKKKGEEAASSSAPPPPTETKVVETKKTPEPPPGPDPKVVERGAYLVKAGGCVVCHTGMGPKGPDLEHAFAGGLEMPDPIGTWRTPNITPDKGTGIGGWTDAQIAAAIREGVRPDGTQLFPIMPYMNYNRMTDADVNAVVAFLRSVKPVERVTAPNKDLKMAKVPAPKPANQSDGGDDPVKHGEYMASIMLCSHCHWTPDKNFAPAGPDKMFSGGLPLELPMLGKGTLITANITSDPETGIGKWTEDQIFTTIKTLTRPDGRPIVGPMMLLQSGWSQLEDKDLKSVAAFVHQLPPVKNKVPASTFKMAGPPPGAPAGAGSGSAAGSAAAPAKK
jgi:mono/diheme cytochrome c family protein